jgi:hypothetical protein
MGYTDGEALLLTRVRAVTGYFSSNNAKRGDWKILNTGKDDLYAIIKQGAGSVEEMVTFGINGVTWQSVIQVWQKYRDANSYTNLLTAVDALKDSLVTYPKIGDSTSTIRDAVITSYSDVQEMWTAQGGLEWLRQDVYFQWTEETNVTFAE